MSPLRQPELLAARRILARLADEGHTAYLAGGAVRDLLLGRTPTDCDIATSARPAQVLALFVRTFAVGAHFGVVLVVEDVEGREIVTEVATFRNDGAYSDGRHPDAVSYSSSPAEDVARRDFTINGLLLDLLKLPAQSKVSVEELRSATLDFCGGLADLDATILRAIGDPRRRFDEDKLRMMRAIRFAARLGYQIEPVTFAVICELAPTIEVVSQERVRDELTRMLTEGRARRAFELLDASGLLKAVLPEVARLKGVEQPPQFHPEGDVWQHTLLLLDQLERDCPPTLAWGALLHDAGKPATFRRAEDRIRFDGHVEIGVKIAEEITRRLRFSGEESAQIAALVANHMRFSDVHRMKQSTLKRFFRMNNFEEHLALHRMDCMASHGHLDNWEFAREHYTTLPPEEIRPTLLVDGRVLIAVGYKPGPGFSRMLQAAEDAQLEGLISTAEQGLSLIRERFGPPTVSSLN
jgi:poly(A) polymerase